MTINKKQRQIVIAGVTLFILMGLFPPWIYTLEARGVSSEKPAGYSLIVDPPEPERYGAPFGVELDVPRLIVQWLVVAATAGLGIFLTKAK